MNLRKFQVIKGSEITRLLAPPPSVFVDEPPREPRVRRQEELRRELEKQIAEKSARKKSEKLKADAEALPTARTKILQQKETLLIEKERKIKILEEQVAELKTEKSKKMSPRQNIMEKSLQGFSHFQALRTMPPPAVVEEDPLNDSLPCEVKFVTISDLNKTWYPETRTLKQSRETRKKNLRISTTPASMPSATNFFPSSTRSDLPPIDAGRVVVALKMATDMNPNMRQKYLDFFEVLKAKQQKSEAPSVKVDPWASESSGSPL